MTESLSIEQYERVAHEVVKAYEAIEDVVKDNENRRGRFVACLLRTGGHDFMDFKHDEEEMGGSDGCINLNDPDNKGIEQCVNNFGIPAVYDQVKDFVSFADFLVIAGQAAAARAATNPEKLAETFRDGFKYGRRTVKECEWNEGRMPNPENGC